MLSLSACAVTGLDLPPITATPASERFPGKIVWHDLLTSDPAASQAFYGELFGWEFEAVGQASGLAEDSAYTLIRHNGALIGGMIDTVALNGRDDISQWVALMSVANIDARVEEVQANGGTVISKPVDLRSRGRVAIIRDREGALIGLLQTRDGDPADRAPEVGDFLWDELWTTDVDAASAFYSSLSGLDISTQGLNEGARLPATYRLLKRGDVPRFGIMVNPLEGLDPVWVSYLRVEDPKNIVARVAALGGRVIVDARPRPAGGEVAFVAGPSGAGIALQTWPPDQPRAEGASR
jgi:predicted enzyme related to lactoylglutathione lyase